MTNPLRGVCPHCASPRILAPDGVLMYHGAVLNGMPYGRCSGTGAPPVTDPERLAALDEFNRHKPGHSDRCRECSTYAMPRYPGAPPGKDRIVMWPCPARHDAWARFKGETVKA